MTQQGPLAPVGDDGPVESEKAASSSASLRASRKEPMHPGISPAVVKSLSDKTSYAWDKQLISAEAFAPALKILADRVGAITSSVTSDSLQGFLSAASRAGDVAAKQVSAFDYSGLISALDIDFRIADRFVEQQSKWTEALGPLAQSLLESFYPPNLRGLEGLKFASVLEVVMADGIPLYGVPRTAIAEALISAESRDKRREILDQEWSAISDDCREVVTSYPSAGTSEFARAVLGALDALDAGFWGPAQALAASIIDTLIFHHFSSQKRKYDPDRASLADEDLERYSGREFVAYAPIWHAYQRFNRGKSDTVPVGFSRHATAHTVSSRQFNRPNAVQALMLACSLLYRLDEQKTSDEASKLSESL